MKRSWSVLAVVLVLVIGAGTWYLLSDHGWHDENFDSCRVEGGYLVLDYTYGVGDDVRTSFSDGARLSVRLEERADGGTHIKVALGGQLRVMNRSGHTSVSQHDGSPLRCR